MKRYLVMLLVLALLAGAVGCSGETYRTISLEAIHAELSVPKEFVCFTRGMAEDDPVLAQFETNSKGVDRGLKSSSAYLMVFDQGQTFNLQLCAVKSETDDYSALDKAGREKLLEEYRTSYEEATELRSLEIRELGDETYVCAQYDIQGSCVWQYATNCNNELYYLVLTAGERSVGEAQLPWVEQMITNLQFTENK